MAKSVKKSGNEYVGRIQGFDRYEEEDYIRLHIERENQPKMQYHRIYDFFLQEQLEALSGKRIKFIESAGDELVKMLSADTDKTLYKYDSDFMHEYRSKEVSNVVKDVVEYCEELDKTYLDSREAQEIIHNMVSAVPSHIWEFFSLQSCENLTSFTNLQHIHIMMIYTAYMVARGDIPEQEAYDRYDVLSRALEGYAVEKSEYREIVRIVEQRLFNNKLHKNIPLEKKFASLPEEVKYKLFEDWNTEKFSYANVLCVRILPYIIKMVGELKDYKPESMARRIKFLSRTLKDNCMDEDFITLALLSKDQKIIDRLGAYPLLEKKVFDPVEGVAKKVIHTLTKVIDRVYEENPDAKREDASRALFAKRTRTVEGDYYKYRYFMCLQVLGALYDQIDSLDRLVVKDDDAMNDGESAS